jgi:hypothetical protein
VQLSAKCTICVQRHSFLEILRECKLCISLAPLSLNEWTCEHIDSPYTLIESPLLPITPISWLPGQQHASPWQRHAFIHHKTINVLKTKCIFMHGTVWDWERLWLMESGLGKYYSMVSGKEQAKNHLFLLCIYSSFRVHFRCENYLLKRHNDTILVSFTAQKL